MDKDKSAPGIVAREPMNRIDLTANPVFPMPDGIYHEVRGDQLADHCRNGWHLVAVLHATIQGTLSERTSWSSNCSCSCPAEYSGIKELPCAPESQVRYLVWKSLEREDLETKVRNLEHQVKKLDELKDQQRAAIKGFDDYRGVLEGAEKKALEQLHAEQARRQHLEADLGAVRKAIGTRAFQEIIDAEAKRGTGDDGKA